MKRKRKTHGIQKQLKEKIQAAPKELARRGLEDGVERLRGQLRDTARAARQTAMAATRLRMPRPVECARRSTVWNGCLEKVKRSAAGPPSTLPQMSRLPRQRTPQRTSLPNSDQESRHGRQSGPLRATPAQGQPAQTASKPAVKTKGTYLQGESAPPTEPPSQAGQVAVREQGRIAARDRAPQRHRPESVSVPRSGGGPASTQNAGGKAGRSSYASPGPSYTSGAPARRISQGHTVPGKGLSVSKGDPRPPRGAVKTAEHTSRRTIKTAGQAAKTAERTARAAPGTMRAAADLTRAHRPGCPRHGPDSGCNCQSSSQIRRGSGQGRHCRRSGVALRPRGGRRGRSCARSRGVPGRNLDRLALRHLFRGRRERPGRRLSICSRGPAQP